MHLTGPTGRAPPRAFGIMGALSLGASAYLFFFRSDAKPRRVGVMPIFGLVKDVGLAAGGMTMNASR